MIPYIDIHTHKSQLSEEVISVRNCDDETVPETWCSIGIHPWQSIQVISDNGFIERSMKSLAVKCKLPQVLFLGETGLDAKRGADMEIQKELFLRHVELSEQLGKPMIIHCVKAIEEIVAIHKQQHPSQRWIMHGYRKNATLANQILRQGIELSFGRYFDAEAMKMAYEANVLWLETDESGERIEDVYQMASEALSVSVEELKLNIYQRAVQLSSSFRGE
ncbi:MAG: TatD family hydrolase [Bacteroidaceae bacterium]|nr:TatD family hydrolase [Bacteroidaceae bacterium]